MRVRRTGRGTATGLFGPEYRRLTTGLLLVMSFVAFEQMSVVTVLPAVLASLHDVALYGWAFSAFMLAQVAGVILAGPTVDRIGLARPLSAACLGFCAGLIVGGLAPSMPVLIGGRAIQGISAGFIVVTLYAGVGRGYPARLQARAFAATDTAWLLPSVVGPALAGIIAQALTWRAVFLGIVPAVLLGAAVARPALSAAEAAQSESAPAQVPARLALAAALAGGAWLALQALSTRKPAVAAAMAVAGLALLVPAIRRVLRAGGRSPATPQRTAMIVAGLAAAAFFGTESYIPLALTSLHDRTLTEAGAVLTAAAVAWVAGSWAQVRAAGRIRARALYAASLALIAVGILGILAISWPSTPWWVVFAAWATAAVGMGVLTNTAAFSAVSRDAPPGGGQVTSVGDSVAGQQVLISLGTAIGAGIGGAMLAWSVRTGYGRAPGLRAFDMSEFALALGAILVALGLRGRKAGSE